ncbi:MAG TPA: prepilin-type N-terminal cleavage/methylation domain-containing protein [Lacipirellulaceae bacterium]|nr:prepilin-type N-terminal cleavage/methylation domain-containing protein [Lacipirellulaceae bacterium]
MRATARRRRARGFTLLELIVSLAAAATLMVGMSSTMYIALRAANPDHLGSPAALRSLACTAHLAAELQFALSVTEAGGTAMTFTVPDRGDADSTPDTIRYAWASAGQPVTRQYNGGTATAVLSSAQSVALQYDPSSAAPRTVTVRIQATADAGTTIETAIPLLNMP